jgi:CubicO group peptidase (beta-lactamase class C family)
LSKNSTWAVGILQLHERGKLDIDAPVQNYLPFSLGLVVMANGTYLEGTGLLDLAASIDW